MIEIQEKRRIRVATSLHGQKTYYPERLISYRKYKFFGRWLTKWEGLPNGHFVHHERTQEQAQEHFDNLDRDRTEEYIDVSSHPHIIGHYNK